MQALDSSAAPSPESEKSRDIRDPSGGSDAAAVYGSRLAIRQDRVSALEHLERQLSWSRLAAFAALVGIAWVAFVDFRIAGWWTLLPLGAFLILVLAHDRTIRKRARAQRGVSHYEEALRRLSREPRLRSVTGDRFADPKHPYALDLDLFGPGSVFELLCTCRTRGGESRLASWLLSPADPSTVVARHQAVSELRDRVELREDLDVLSEEVLAEVDLESLDDSGVPGSTGRFGRLRAVATVLAASNTITLVGWPLLGWGSLPFTISALISIGVGAANRPRFHEMVSGVEHLSDGLLVFSRILERIESERFGSDLLSDLRSQLARGGVAPSRAIARLGRLVSLLDSRRNQFFAPIAAMLFWGTHVGLSIRAWRLRHQNDARVWIDAVAELEALVSLSTFAWEHPHFAFPRVSSDEPLLFDAAAIGHPLIPENQLVRNDVRLDQTLRMLIVSGSNMSGKSTLLRTIGVNAVLALAGAPVSASRLTLSRLHVGASIQVRDSLVEGRSRFYAEISRIRQLVEMSEGELPLLFLIDEILHGTNSHDRRIGASAILSGLLERGAIGLVTTHDLAITVIEENFPDSVRNVHFEDHIEEGRMAFDYRMHDGTVKRSNAIELMRSVGLEV